MRERRGRNAMNKDSDIRRAEGERKRDVESYLDDGPDTGLGRRRGLSANDVDCQ